MWWLRGNNINHNAYFSLRPLRLCVKKNGSINEEDSEDIQVRVEKLKIKINGAFL